MKKILAFTTEENQGKGEMSAIVLRGHASVQLIIDCFGMPGDHAVDVHLKPEDAMRIADAIQQAAREIQQSSENSN